MLGDKPSSLLIPYLLHSLHMNPFWIWWQNLPSHINPYIASFGPVRLHWYGLMYVVAFTVGYLLVAWRVRKGEVGITIATLQDFMTWAVLGVVVGGRLGYAIFYAPLYFLKHPLQLVLPFSDGRFTGIAGMSFHGGLIGIIIATLWFVRKKKLSLWKFADAFVPATALAFMFGRIGNFLNGELWGRETDVPWAMRFPRAGDALLRHPSQLYEALGEGLLLFLILWPLRNRKSLESHFLALYLIGYGLIRFLIEYVREPDRHLGNVLGPFTMGQTLSAVTLIGGILLLNKNKLKRMFWDKWFKKEAAPEAPKPEMTEEAPTETAEAAPAPAPEGHTHESEDEKQACDSCK